jgi:acetylornithine deacetylase/succinyl-diaminopimelate desuccinylase-like protein
MSALEELARAVADAVDPARVEQIARALITAKQPGGDQEEERARVLQDLLNGEDLDVELDWVLPNRPNLIARVRGRGEGPGLLLNGHLDAAYHPTWSRDPHEPWVQDGRLYGGGVTDMLGGVASMAAAVEAIAQLGPPPGEVVLLASMHHDTIGLGVKYALSSEHDFPRFGICGEPSELAIHTANGGAIKFMFTLEGQLAHVSRLEEGIDALAAAVALYGALGGIELTHTPDPRLPDLPLVHVGELKSGFAPGCVADLAVLSGDIRTVPTMTRASVRADLEGLARAVVPADVPWRLDLTAVQRAYIGPEEGALIDGLAAAHEAVLGAPVRVSQSMPVQAFITDTADMQALGVESVIYGPADWHYVPDESVAIEELVAAARVYAVAGLTFTGPGAR